MSKDLTRHLENLNLDKVELRPLSKSEFSDFKELVATYKFADGFKRTYSKLITDRNYKLAKSEIPNFGLSLAPADLSGDWNTCRYATDGCRKACLGIVSGRNTFGSSKRAKIWRTKLLADHPQIFIRALADEIRYLNYKYVFKGVTQKDGSIKKAPHILFRFNVVSDLRFERFAPQLFELENVKFYDYTKYPTSKRSVSNNYRLVGSFTERTTDNQLADYVNSFGSSAVVFLNELPKTFKGFKVVDGDLSDDRTLKKEVGVVVGLTAKGSAVNDASGFVQRLNNQERVKI